MQNPDQLMSLEYLKEQKKKFFQSSCCLWEKTLNSLKHKDDTDTSTWCNTITLPTEHAYFC